MDMTRSLVAALLLFVSAPQVSAADDITIYWPSPYFNRPDDSTRLAVKLIRQRFDALSVGYYLESLPVRRAVTQYRSDPTGCSVGVTGRAQEGEVASAPMMLFKFWYYVLQGSPLTAPGDVQSAVTISGAELFSSFQDDDRVNWTLAPNYDSVVGMLRSKRVEAATLLEATLPDIEGAEAFRKLEGSPAFAIHMSMVCKDTPRNRDFIEKVDKNWGEPVAF
ncbi:hypothetical protein [Kordiimonas lacus]|nr:hypothetical protein [Kordiimonas lacus]